MVDIRLPTASHRTHRRGPMVARISEATRDVLRSARMATGLPYDAIILNAVTAMHKVTTPHEAR
ncbi:MAG TPA: hypothetical protein VFW89_04115 [Gemmatimonadaceae bacterium]|nr:hypothetical protein [Gemmatimonadaceae bacterium]